MRFAVFLLMLALAPLPGRADVLEKILDRGSVRLGVRSDAPPFSYFDAKGQPAGLAVRLCHAVVELIARHHRKEPLKISHVRVNARERFPALQSGRTDLHCGPASATLSRRETLDFSLLYFVDGAAAAVRPGGFESVFTKRTGRFGYLGGTTTEAVVKDLIQRNDLKAETKSFDNHPDGLRALNKGELDIYFGDQAILVFQISRLGLQKRISTIEETFSFEPYALVMKRGESRLRLAVDRALSTIYERGMIYSMIARELGEFQISNTAKSVYEIVGMPE